MNNEGGIFALTQIRDKFINKNKVETVTKKKFNCLMMNVIQQ